MFSFEKLEVWQLALDYAKVVYKVTKEFPSEELYGLISQLRRASVSISSNIAEGSGAIGYKDKLHYLDIAIKSTLETVSELNLSYNLGFISLETRDSLYEAAEKIIRKLRNLKKSIK